MPYTQVTLDQLATALSIRLGDPSRLFWITAELYSYLREAMRTWQAFSNFTSEEGTFNTAAGVPFYNLFQLISDLAPSITDQDIIQDIQRALQEPVSPTSWPGNSDQFSLAGVTAAIAKRRDRFLVETGLVENQSEIAGPTPPNGSQELDQSTIDVRRVAWKTGTGSYIKLWPADTFMLTAGSQSWTVPSVPSDFTTFFSNPLTLLLAPPPAIGLGGNVNLITVNSGPDLNPASGPTILGIPDDFCWVIKFGALADLLGQDGPGQDVSRAAYCESRWSDGVKLARITNYVRLGYNQGVPSFVDAIEDLDTANPDWMNETPGPPNSLNLSGNIVAVEPTPDAVYALSFTIIPKFPVPSAGGNYVQIGKEFLDTILDYAQHLAMFKEGAVKETMGLYQNFVQEAAVENDILKARATDFDVLSDRTTREENLNPRRRSDFMENPQDIING